MTQETPRLDLRAAFGKELDREIRFHQALIRVTEELQEAARLAADLEAPSR